MWKGSSLAKPQPPPSLSNHRVWLFHCPCSLLGPCFTGWFASLLSLSMGQSKQGCKGDTQAGALCLCEGTFDRPCRVGWSMNTRLAGGGMEVDSQMTCWWEGWGSLLGNSAGCWRVLLLWQEDRCFCIFQLRGRAGPNRSTSSSPVISTVFACDPWSQQTFV